MGIQTALDEVRQATSILDGIRRADRLTVAASRDGSPRTVRILAAAADSADQLTAIAAVHALGHVRVRGASADEVLISLLRRDSLFLREHAAWALGARPAHLDGIPDLVMMVADGGFPGMLAQRTLERWGLTAPEQVALCLASALTQVADPDARARLVETVGRAPGRIPEQLLRCVAVDPHEGDASRAAAIEALGDRRPSEAIMSVVTDIARGTGALADVAGLALFDLTAQPHPHAPWSQGSAIAQVFLHADIDRELSQVGAGDNGGIATLLVRLGDALVAESQRAGGGVRPDGQAQVNRVVTISRGSHAEALSSLSYVRPAQGGHALAPVPFLGEPVPATGAWPRRIATQRGIRRVLRAAGPIHAIHLRMADVGSLAAGTVARERGIPIVFTVAPDPHAVIDTLDSSGDLSRESFGTVDEGEHFWFRARLVHRIAADAAHIVLFPRQELKRDMRRLLGLDIEAHPERHSVLAEGIDLTVIERSCSEAQAAARVAEDMSATVTGSSGAAAAPVSPSATLAFDELDALLRSLPTARRGLPLAITVGRLHPVKGMATLVEAWAANPGLRERCNLLVVGGDLEHPSRDEQEQLSRMAAVFPIVEAPAHGLLLAGHRPNATAAYWLAAARYGRPGLAAPHGVYVCASLKEEFGLALLEAMATGLVVVAPGSGGPATYIESGVTGFLVDTRDTVALEKAVMDALDLAVGPGGNAMAKRARDMVAQNFTIQAMAASLSNVYARVDAAHQFVTSPVMVS